jgi:hypothetical protein
MDSTPRFIAICIAASQIWEKLQIRLSKQQMEQVIQSSAHPQALAGTPNHLAGAEFARYCSACFDDAF